MYPFDPEVLFEDLTHPTEHPAERRGHSWFKGVRTLDLPLLEGDPPPPRSAVPSQRQATTPLSGE